MPNKPEIEDDALEQLNTTLEHGIITKQRVIQVVDELDYVNFSRLDLGLSIMEAESKAKITIRILSQGGITYAATAMAARITDSKAYIVTEGYGQIASAATLLLASGNHRRMSRLATFMWHEATITTDDGKHSDTRASLKQLEVEELLWAEEMSRLSKGKTTPAFWSKLGVGIDAYLTPTQLLQYGVIDEIF
jgi:ATP-dependent protease ClpP protease subunit